MKVIQTQEDFDQLKRDGLLEPEMAEHLTQFITSLQAVLDEMSPNTYDLGDAGSIVILEKGDDVRNLTEIGLGQGLMEFIPEWFQVVALDGIAYYRFLILLGDSFGIVFFSPIGIYDNEVETWFVDRLVEEQERLIESGSALGGIDRCW